LVSDLENPACQLSVDAKFRKRAATKEIAAKLKPPQPLPSRPEPNEKFPCKDGWPNLLLKYDASKKGADVT